MGYFLSNFLPFEIRVLHCYYFMETANSRHLPVDKYYFHIYTVSRNFTIDVKEFSLCLTSTESGRALNFTFLSVGGEEEGSVSIWRCLQWGFLFFFLFLLSRFYSCPLFFFFLCLDLNVSKRLHFIYYI